MQKYLLICNAYPTVEKVYANGFLHRRVKSYQKAGLDVRVIVITTKVLKDKFYDGVHIKYMDEYQIASHLKENEYGTALFHFINPKMFYGIEALPAEDRPNIVVWLHGFEAEAWHRRYYNFLDDIKKLDAQLEKKDTTYETQREFLRGLMTSDAYNIKFVYVSKAFKELYADPFTGVVPERFYIIPNIVDETLFPYHRKERRDRLSICSIRPYTARNYANDLTVEFIQKISKKRYFKKLTFNLYGDGPLFDRINQPLKKYDNVHLHKRFVPQGEIPDIHREHGVFLGPSRHDSQGVSLGEAMSSGLVPISNAIGGIPEFVGHGQTGMLAGRDDVDGMVAHYDRLYKEPKKFLKMSERASGAIRQQAGIDTVIRKELEVITSDWS